MIEELVGNTRRNLRAVTPAQHVLMCNQYAAGLGYRSCNRFPVVKARRAQVDQFDAYSVLTFQSLCGLQGARHHGSIGHDG